MPLYQVCHDWGVQANSSKASSVCPEWTDHGVNGSVCPCPTFLVSSCSRLAFTQHRECSPHCLEHLLTLHLITSSRYPTPTRLRGCPVFVHLRKEMMLETLQREMAPSLSSLSSNAAHWDWHSLRSGAIKLLATFGSPWLWAPAPICAFGSHPRISWLVITHQAPHSPS